MSLPYLSLAIIVINLLDKQLLWERQTNLYLFPESSITRVEVIDTKKLLSCMVNSKIDWDGWKMT